MATAPTPAVAATIKVVAIRTLVASNSEGPIPPGKTVDLSEADAAYLIEIGAASLFVPEPAPDKPAPEEPAA